MGKESGERRAPLSRVSDYTKAFKKDWERYRKAGKVDMNSAVELTHLIIFRKPLGPEWLDHELAGSEWDGAREALLVATSCSSTVATRSRHNSSA